MTQMNWLRGSYGNNGNVTDDYSYAPVANFEHIKTNISDPGGYADPANQAGSACVTNMLVEEYDGYTWRVVAGNAPIYGRDMNNVVVTDALNANMTFGGFLNTPANVTTSVSGSNLTWSMGTLIPGDAGTLTYWATVKSGTANGTVIPNNSQIVADKEQQQTSNNAPVTVGGVALPTATFTRTFTPTHDDVHQHADADVHGHFHFDLHLHTDPHPD